MQLIRQLPGWGDFSPEVEKVKILKPAYGLKGAPKAWRKRLHAVLEGVGAQQPLAEPEPHTLHDYGRTAALATHGEEH